MSVLFRSSNRASAARVSRTARLIWTGLIWTGLTWTVLAWSSPSQAQRSYRVRQGDSLHRIAARFNTTVRDLLAENNLRSTTIRPGSRLRIPRRGRGGRRSNIHVVRKGETLSRVAARYRTTIGRLKRSNRLKSNHIWVSQRLRIPGRENPIRVRRAPLTEPQETARDFAKSLGLGSVKTAHWLLSKPPKPEWIAAARVPPDTRDDATSIAKKPEGSLSVVSPAEHEPPPAPTPGTFQLPLQIGHMLRGWGSGAGGYHLAVDIYAPPGTPVHASETGIVAYSGHGVSGYGWFVMLVHPSGHVTAYAHNRQNLVVAGERVERGQVIAKLGNTGLSAGPHLHFMLIFDGRHCDPAPLFRPKLRQKNGDAVKVDRAVWEAEAGKPPVRCLARSARPHPHRAALARQKARREKARRRRARARRQKR